MPVYSNVKTSTGTVHVGAPMLTMWGTTVLGPGCASGRTSLRTAHETDDRVTCSRCLAVMARREAQVIRENARVLRRGGAR